MRFENCNNERKAGDDGLSIENVDVGVLRQTVTVTRFRKWTR